MSLKQTIEGVVLEPDSFAIISTFEFLHVPTQQNVVPKSIPKTGIVSGNDDNPWINNEILLLIEVVLSFDEDKILEFFDIYFLSQNQDAPHQSNN